MRLKHKAATYYDEWGKRVELLPLLRKLAAGEVLDVTLHYYSEPRKPASAKPPLKFLSSTVSDGR